MSFSFAGVGPLHEVIAQVRSHHAAGGTPAAAARDAVTAALEAAGTPRAIDGHELRYVVKASGHHGNGHLSLDVHVETHWVPVAPQEVQFPKPAHGEPAGTGG